MTELKMFFFYIPFISSEGGFMNMNKYHIKSNVSILILYQLVNWYNSIAITQQYSKGKVKYKK